MKKHILITGSTDGIGLEAAKILLQQGHHILLHGRSKDKLQKLSTELAHLGQLDTFCADLSDLQAVSQFAKDVTHKYPQLDVLINNAGVLKTTHTNNQDGIDMRFVVNTIAPYLLTTLLLPLLKKGRIINISSAAQMSVDLLALVGKGKQMNAMDTYSQSKLAIIMWSFAMAKSLNQQETMICSVNPGSLLASKMVKEGFGIEGKDIDIGAKILVRSALSDDFAQASGKYFDNDIKQFTSPHQDAFNIDKCYDVIHTIENLLVELKIPYYTNLDYDITK